MTLAQWICVGALIAIAVYVRWAVTRFEPRPRTEPVEEFDYAAHLNLNNERGRVR
jgi:hypothetical protein